MADVETLELAQVVVSTVATICMIGLGFLYRPGTASLLWSLTFILAMVTSYAEFVAEMIDSEPLRRASLGVLLCAPVLIWSGLRAYRNAPPRAWMAVLVGLGGAATLLAFDGVTYAWAFRVLYAIAAVYAALTVVELVRRPERGRGTALPLLLFSLALVVVAVVSAAAGVLASGDSAGALSFIRTVNSLGMLAYIVGALVTLLFLARGGVVVSQRALFYDVAAERLERAQAAGERSWALLYVQLDDEKDLRSVTGEAGFVALTEGLRDDIREIFPTESDIGRLGPAAFAVLVALPSTVIRERINTLLRAIATPNDDLEVGTSASVGWAGVAEHGYELDALLDAARSAAATAGAAGGDRWQRADAGSRADA